MKSRKLDDQIREYYDSQQLSNDARARITAMVRSGAPSKESSRWWWIRTGIAASFVIAVIAAALWLAVLRDSAPESQRRVGDAVAQQAAMGHNQRQELEFRASRTAELREMMTSLDFTPVEPETMSRMKMRIVGARYTTIEGVMAAQILYLDPKGEPCMLYQARPVENLSQVPPGEHVVDGLRVSVWREKGLLMVLTRPVA